MHGIYNISLLNILPTQELNFTKKKIQENIHSITRNMFSKLKGISRQISALFSFFIFHSTLLCMEN